MNTVNDLLYGGSSFSAFIGTKVGNAIRYIAIGAVLVSAVSYWL